ncbi:Haloacetate dehalogenase H-1 [Candidatus Thermoflexus japonica]|uniref:Haloacetate dehalogenase H-1 n=1 Tax=Candidatus Thermoflexus japonica TaxID=2035417 RepID=A0A2H5Y510_9CHLR|nr:Haloacetate dehalogenase H-1 [Candidatus Thermoflexus japonica]
MRIPHLEGIRCEQVTTSRLDFHVLFSGPPDGEPVVFLHGNVSSATFWEETMQALPSGFRGIAPDLRGYGESERRPVDATRGLRDFSDDLHALVEALGLTRFHLVGHSMGGGIAMQYAIDHADRILSLTLVDPLSPFGFGGTKDPEGTPCWPDYAGSGGGTANPEFVRRLAMGDRGEESDFSPRRVLRAFCGKAPFLHPREDILVESMVRTAVGEENYPGDFQGSANWPGVAPGTRGVNNAMSPKYCNLSALVRISPKPPVLWVRGAEDTIVSDTSLFDFGYLGVLGMIPGWPGETIYPPQPMIAQTRAVLERYRAGGGQYREEVIPAAGHTPYLERPEIFQEIFHAFLRR